MIKTLTYFRSEYVRARVEGEGSAHFRRGFRRGAQGSFCRTCRGPAWGSSRALESCSKRSSPGCSRSRRCGSATKRRERSGCPTIDEEGKQDLIGPDRPLKSFSVLQSKGHSRQPALERNILDCALLPSIESKCLALLHAMVSN